jgi:hypothetical protein
MSLLVGVILVAVAMAVGIVREVIMLGFMPDFAKAMTPFATASAVDVAKVIKAVLTAAGPAIVVAMLIQGLADAVLRVVAVAPWAKAYEQLTSQGD